MKKLLFLLIATFLFVGCQNSDCNNGVQDGGEEGVDCGSDCVPCTTCDNNVMDGNETGIDCGGDCNPCEPDNPTQPQEFYDMQGVWYLDYSYYIEEYNSPLTISYIKRGSYYDRSDCKFELTDVIVGYNMFGQTNYKMNGSLSSCAFGTNNTYNYPYAPPGVGNPPTLSLENDSLLQYSHTTGSIEETNKFYKRTPTTYAPIKIVDWEFTIFNYPYADQLIVVVGEDTIPIIPSQNTYSGSTNVNTSSSGQTTFELNIKTANGYDPATSETIEFSASLSVNDLSLSRVKDFIYCVPTLTDVNPCSNGLHMYSIHQSSSFGCKIFI